MDKPFKTCKVHGDLTIEQVSSYFDNRYNKKYYRCTQCFKISNKKYYTPEKSRDKFRKYHAENKGKINARVRLNYKLSGGLTKKQNNKKRKKEVVKNLGDGYIKHNLSYRMGYLFNQGKIPTNFIAFKKNLIKFKRHISNTKDKMNDAQFRAACFKIRILELIEKSIIQELKYKYMMGLPLIVNISEDISYE